MTHRSTRAAAARALLVHALLLCGRARGDDDDRGWEARELWCDGCYTPFPTTAPSAPSAQPTPAPTVSFRPTPRPTAFFPSFFPSAQVRNRGLPRRRRIQKTGVCDTTHLRQRQCVQP